MNPLLTAIETQFQAASPLNACAGPWLDVAKDTEAYPYCVYSVLSAAHEPIYGGVYDDVTTVRFTIYQSTAAATITLQDALHARFDKQKLTLSAGRNYDSLRRNALIRYAGFVDKNGEQVWQAVTDYRFRVRRDY